MKIVLCAALLTHIFWIAYHPSSELIGDSVEYVQLAHNIREHHFFGFDSQNYFRPPGYPFLLSLVGEEKLLLFIQSILGIGTSLLVYLIALPYGRKLAVSAGILMSVSPMSGFFTTQVMTETLYTFLITLGIYLWSHQVWAGIVLGLSWLVRPTTLPFLAFILIVGLFRKKIQRPVIVLVACLTVSPWIVRNAIVFHTFVPVSLSGGGLNLLSGTFNIPYGSGNPWSVWLKQPEIITPYPTGDPRNDRLYIERAVAKIKANPAQWLATRIKQYPRLFLDAGSYLINNRVMKFLFVIGNILFVLLGLYGVYLVGFDRLSVFPIFLLLFHLPLWVEARYALPMVPMMVVLACVSANCLAKMVNLQLINSPPGQHSPDITRE